jgi:site-specific DNA recombinase
LYLKCGGLLATVQELEKRGWKNKRWQTRQGHNRGGMPFTKGSLHHLLTNVVYRGKVKYKKEVHAAEHKPIVEAQIWQQVQERLGRQKRSRERLSSQALLKGLLYCRPCNTAMTPTYASKNCGRRYGYYVCTNALQRGRTRCPSRSLPQTVIEQWVLERLQQVAQEADAKQLSTFTELATWDQVPPQERSALLRTWITRVDYDGTQDKATITFAAPAPKDSAKSRQGKHP